MCRLFVLVANKNVDISFSMLEHTAFISRARIIRTVGVSATILTCVR